MRFRERRFNRKLHKQLDKREEFLRLMENRVDKLDHSNGYAIPISQGRNPPRAHWICGYCEREFLSYPALLNHKCNDWRDH